MTKFSIWLIKQYQLILSPYVGQQCRFYPTCSQYSIESFHKHGFLKGLFYSVRRIACCHPFHPGGHDPIP